MWNFFLTFLATTVVGELLRPKPKFNTPQPSALGDFQMPTAEYGRAVPVVYGECYMQAPNVTWYGDLRVEAITEKVKTGWFSSTRVTKGYKYYMGAQLVFAKGFSDWELAHGSGLVELRFDDRRPTALEAGAQQPPKLLVGMVQSYGATYAQDTLEPAGPGSRFTRVTVSDENLFGGEEKEGGFGGVVDVHYGQPGAVPNDYLQSVFGTSEIPAYRGYLHAVLRRCYIGTTSYPKTVSAVVRRYPWFWADAVGYRIGNDANPLAVIVDLMSNADHGLGIARAKFGASFRQAALQCYEEGLGISMTFDTQGNARDMVSEVLRHVDGVLYEDPTTGLFEVALARADYDPASLLTLDPDNVLELELTRPSWSETKNVVRVQYLNAANNFTPTVVELQNSANIATRGGEKSVETFSFNGLSTSANAMRVAERILRTVSHPLARLYIKATRAAFELRPGSVFALDWPELGVANLVCRVTRVSYGTIDEPAIVVDAVEDIFGTLATQFTAPPESEWQNPTTVLGPNAAEALLEAPFHLVGAEQRSVMTLAARSTGLAQGYIVLSNPAGVLEQTAEVSTFTPTGRLAASLSAEATSLNLVGTIDMPELPAITAAQQRAGVYLLALGGELMTFTQAVRAGAGAGYTLSGLVRGVLDTLPAAHEADVRAWLVSTAAGLVQSTGYTQDRTITAKLLPFDTSRQLQEAEAQALTLTTTSRALKPYPPGRVSLAAVDGGGRVLRWKHRPKSTLRAAGVFVGHVEATDYEAEAGTLYLVRASVGGVVVRTEAAAGDSFTYTPEMYAVDAGAGGLVTLSVAARRGDFESAPVATAAFSLD